MKDSKKNLEAIVEVKDLVAGYGNQAILENLSFSIKKGEIFGILGGSGCGKSTVLKHLIGLHPPLSGEILIESQNLVKAQGDERLQLLRRIGVMYQSGALFGAMTLLENVRLPLEEHTSLPQEAIHLIARIKLTLVGLEGFETYFPSQLSGGMQKRAAIARALVLEPAILFLDEPGAGLDPITSVELDHLILNINQQSNTTFVIVTHELDSIYTLMDRVIMLDKNTKGILAEGNPHELRDHSDNTLVRQFFHREANKK